MDFPNHWRDTIREWAEATPEVLSVTAYGSRVTGFRRDKPDRKPAPDIDLAIQTRDDDYGTAYGHFVFLRGEWERRLSRALGVAVDLKHHDPRDPDDDVAPYLAAGSSHVWP